MTSKVLISGGTGYLGAPLIHKLLTAGFDVTVLVRPGSQAKVPPGARVVVGDALDPESFSAAGFDTLIHLVGTPKPAPWKGEQFRRVDLPSLRASVAAAARDGVHHFVYVSVAQPAPIMRAYVQVRQECERIIESAGFRATILRPWYVVGPGHYWPLILQPLYWLAEHIPGLRDAGRRLGLIDLREMVGALAWAVKNPPLQKRVLGVIAIRDLGSRVAHPGFGARLLGNRATH